MAVPVLADYLVTVQDYGVRLSRGLTRNLGEKRAGLTAAKMPKLEAVLAPPRQRLDLARLPNPELLLAPKIQKLH